MIFHGYSYDASDTFPSFAVSSCVVSPHVAARAVDTMLSLFMAIANGVSWHELVAPLRQLGPKNWLKWVWKNYRTCS